VALALLIAIWGVFLGVTLVRKRADYKADSSIGAFQRQLQVLRRNSQALDQSRGLGQPQVANESASASRNGTLPAFAPSQLRQLHQFDPGRPVSYDGADDRVALIAARGGKQDPYFRPEACERRRDVLLILGTAVVSTGLVSIIPAARMALVVTAVAGVALLLYLVLLVRLRSHATEREMKLRYMPAAFEAPAYADRRIIAR
jgi:hypothetical protein